MAGGRRMAAAELLQWEEIAVVVRENPDELDLREVELIENIFRMDLGWAERVELTARIHALYSEKKKGDWTQTETAELVDRAVGSVNQHLLLAEAMEILPELREAKTEDEANKRFNAFYESLLVAEAKKRKAVAEATEAEQHTGTVAISVDDDTTDPPPVTGDDTTDSAPITTSPSRTSPAAVFLMRLGRSYRIGDAFDGLAKLPDEGERLKFAEVDPPYAIGIHEKKREGIQTADQLKEYEEIEPEDYPEFLRKLTTELYRVLAPHAHIVFWFGIQWYQEVHNALTAAGFLIDSIPAIWKKKQGQTNQPELYLARTYEPFFYGRKPGGYGNIHTKKGRSNIFEHSGVSSTLRYHPTQKPVPLLVELITVFGSWLPESHSDILVPFLGSGSTILAGEQLGYKVIGWDLSAEYREKFLFAAEYTYNQRFKL